MLTLRLWHSYLSVFVAPSILFFALTGAVQLFDLHEAHDDYTPPVLIEKLGRLHKDQIFAQDERSEPAASPEEPIVPSPSLPPRRASTLLLKWFFLAASVVLVLSTCLGLWIALTHIKRRKVSGLLFLAGTLLPIGLLFV